MRAGSRGLPGLWSDAAPPQDQGAALLLALLGMALALALGGAMLALANIEVVGVGQQRDGLQTLYAADAALESTLDELRHVPDWTSVLSGSSVSRVTDSTMVPVTNVAGRLDLPALTIKLQAETDVRNHWGMNGPQWRLFAYGPLTAFAPGALHGQAAYLAVWLADDEAEVDSDPLADSNDSIRIRAAAFGPRGARRITEAVILRTAHVGVIRLVSWREAR